MSSTRNRHMLAIWANYLKQNWVLAFGFIIVFTGLLTFFYNLGESQATCNATLAQGDRALLKTINAMEIEKNQHVKEISVLKYARKIDKLAIESTRTTIQQLETEKSQLAQELAFYRSIMVPGTKETGVRVQTIKLRPLAQGHTFHFQMIIAQVSRTNAFLKGNVSITIEGFNRGEKKELSLFQLAGIDQDSLPLGFRYFQALPEKPDAYLVTLPEGFTPKAVRVAIDIRSGSKQQLDKTYEWANLLEKSNGNLSSQDL